MTEFKDTILLSKKEFQILAQVISEYTIDHGHGDDISESILDTNALQFLSESEIEYLSKALARYADLK